VSKEVSTEASKEVSEELGTEEANAPIATRCTRPMSTEKYREVPDAEPSDWPWPSIVEWLSNVERLECLCCCPICSPKVWLKNIEKPLKPSWLPTTGTHGRRDRIGS